MEINPKIKVFTNYLLTGETTAGRAEVGVRDPLADLIETILALGMRAKDLHYDACGKSFPAIHELADRAYYITKYVDDIFETHYLGEQGAVPRNMHTYYYNASQIALNALSTGGPQTENSLINGLICACERVLNQIEGCKKGNYSSGVTAVLDEIAKEVLVVKGLLCRTNI